MYITETLLLVSKPCWPCWPCCVCWPFGPAVPDSGTTFSPVKLMQHVVPVASAARGSGPGHCHPTAAGASVAAFTGALVGCWQEDIGCNYCSAYSVCPATSSAWLPVHLSHPAVLAGLHLHPESWGLRSLCCNCWLECHKWCNWLAYHVLSSLSAFLLACSLPTGALGHNARQP